MPVLSSEPIMVGRVGKAHGIRGDLTIDVRTDAPELRFREGVALSTDPGERGPLTISEVRWHSGRLLVHFDGVDDRSAAEALRGTALVIDSAARGEAGDDAWWDDDLIGLLVRTVDGRDVGRLIDVVHAPAQNLLVVAREGAGELLVPFVAAIVPTVDVAAGVVVLDPPPGLLDDAQDTAGPDATPSVGTGGQASLGAAAVPAD